MSTLLASSYLFRKATFAIQIWSFCSSVWLYKMVSVQFEITYLSFLLMKFVPKIQAQGVKQIKRRFIIPSTCIFRAKKEEINSQPSRTQILRETTMHNCAKQIALFYYKIWGLSSLQQTRAFLPYLNEIRAYFRVRKGGIRFSKAHLEIQTFHSD